MQDTAIALRPDETLLVGSWELVGGRVVGDKTCDRIQELVGSKLERVADHPEDESWESLYRDASDGRLWELFYPRSDMHGGGPPSLRWLNAAEAESKYGTLTRAAHDLSRRRER